MAQFREESAELQRILEWSKETVDGSLSDFDEEPNPKVWSQVCSERGLCSPKMCGCKSDFAQINHACFFQKARQRIMSADVVVLNHTLFFTLLNTVEEPAEGGVLFRNDFINVLRSDYSVVKDVKGPSKSGCSF